MPAALKLVLENLPGDTNPMDVLRTGCSTLGCLEPEGPGRDQFQVADRLLAIFPSILLYWYQFHKTGKRIETQTADETIAAQFLHLLLGKPADDFRIRAMDSSLILYAEHEFNASTFATRITTSTLADFYSATTSGIGTLRGPLHGGANEEAMGLIQRFKTPDEAEKGLMMMLEKKELIMGFGHRVYKTSDPRSGVIKDWAKKLAGIVGDTRIYPVSERIESRHVAREETFSESRFLQRGGLSLLRRSHADVHAALCHRAHLRLVRAHHRAAQQQPSHPSHRGIHRPAAPPFCAD